MESRTIELSEILDAQRVSGVTVRVTLLCFLIMVADSYDVSALSFAVPELIRQWHVDKIATGTVFSASLFGLMIGSVLFGFIGDRWGRKTAIIAGSVVFGALTLATGFATSLNEMLAIRFLACVGLGGAVPNAVALTNEYSPRHARVTSIAVIFAGYALGGTLGGVISAQLVPIYGWPVIFYLGGAVSLMLALALIVWLPESIGDLALRPEGAARAVELAAWIRPDLDLNGVGRISVWTEDDRSQFVLKRLFAGQRAAMTPLLWIVYIANSVTLFALVSWLPVLVESAGMSRGVAATALSLFFLGGAVGGLAVGRLIDRSGMLALVMSAAIGSPIVASLGIMGGSSSLLLAAATAAGFFTIGVQNSLHGIAGKIYPTSIRSNGIGWALGVGKIGSIAGPFIGGVLLAWALPVQQLFWAAAVPIALVAVAAFFLMRLYDSNVHEEAVDPVPAIEQVGKIGMTNAL
jgi:AAHS family 4-hydroxybenzoate transporter-like MFS transporter